MPDAPTPSRPPSPAVNGAARPRSPTLSSRPAGMASLCRPAARNLPPPPAPDPAGRSRSKVTFTLRYDRCLRLPCESARAQSRYGRRAPWRCPRRRTQIGMIGAQPDARSCEKADVQELPRRGHEVRQCALPPPRPRPSD
jgi:hypothetical protein